MFSKLSKWKNPKSNPNPFTKQQGRKQTNKQANKLAVRSGGASRKKIRDLRLRGGVIKTDETALIRDLSGNS